MSRDKEMLGSYGPKKDSYVCTTPRRGWEEAPAGAMVRGKFKAKSAFLDDDKQKVRRSSFVAVSRVAHAVLFSLRSIWSTSTGELLFFLVVVSVRLWFSRISFAIAKDWNSSD